MSEENKRPLTDEERSARHERIVRRRKKRRNKKIALIAAEVVLLVVVVACIILLNGLDNMIVNVDPTAFKTNPDNSAQADRSTELRTDENGETVFVDVTPSTKTDESQNGSVEPAETSDEKNYELTGDKFSKRYTTIAVFGMDGRDPMATYATGSNSDVIILVSIDNQSGEIRMSSVYRDCIMKLANDDTKYYNKANYAICTYGIVTAINTLNMNLDLDIDYFICVDWEASIELINALDGVDVVLEKKFFWTKDKYGNTVPYFNGLLSELVKDTDIPSVAIPEEYFDGSVYHLDGSQAVAYMRMRYGDSDIQRTRRQREVIDQVIVKAKKVDFGQLLKIWGIVSNSVKMNISENDIFALLQNIAKYNFSSESGSQGYPTEFYDGAKYEKAEQGKVYSYATQWMIVPVDVVKNVKQLHSFLYPQEEYTPTSTLYNVADEIRRFGLFDENWKLTIE